MRSTGISFRRSKLLQWCSYFTLKPELELTVIAHLAGRNAHEVLYTGFLQTPSGDSYDAVVSKTKTEARSTLNLENEAPHIENEAPKPRKRSNLDRKRSTQKLDTGLSFINTRPMLIQQESSTITNRMQFKSTQVVNAFPPLRGRPGGRPCFGRDQKTENAQTISRMLLYCQ